VKEAINELVAKELGRANAMYRDHFASLHEGESVIREEIEEVEENMEIIKTAQARLWKAIRRNNPQVIYHQVEEIGCFSRAAIKELVQVAAMSEKFLSSFRGKEGAGRHEKTT